MVPKLFVLSVRCPICAHANDHDFRFCQRCGYQRKVCKLRCVPFIDFDLKSIDNRLQQLDNFEQATSYSKQKQSLQSEIETFLPSLPGSPTLMTVTPRDICRFLLYKDSNGKTQVHVLGCPHLGDRGIKKCGCPVRLSYKTVDSYIGKLRSIFHNAGRDGEYDNRLGFGNPAADKSVETYLRLVTSEQLQARITPK